MADFQTLFERAPDSYLVLGIDPLFTIQAATEAYLQTTMTERREIVGQPLFEVFPSNPADPAGDDLRGLRESLRAAIATGERQQIALHRYDIRRSRAQGGGFERRHWRVCHIPLLSPRGEVEQILQRIEDVTSAVEAREREEEQKRIQQALVDRADAARREVDSRRDELARTHRQLEVNERKLQDTETRLDVAASVGEIATWILELETGRIFADETVARWFHLPPGGAQGGSLDVYLKAVHPDDIDGLKSAIEKSATDGSSLGITYRVRSSGQQWRWVNVKARIEQNTAGRPVRLLGVVIDVTPLREATEALAEVEARLQLAADAGEIGMFSWSMPPGNIISNHRCREHFWLPADEDPTVHRLFSMLHPDDRERSREAVERSIAEHRPFDVEYRSVSPTGRIRWLRAKGRAYYDASGKPTRFDGITIDNTSLRTIEADLRGSEARYRLLVESLHEYAIFTQDDQGHVTSWNPGAERLLGYAEEEIMGRSARILFTPEDRARGEDTREIETAKRTGRANDDRWHLRKDGTRFFVTGMMVALFNDAGERIGLAKIMRDITDRQIATAERERLLESERAARAEAERTSRLKDEFLATLSHELRTPLNAILGWTQVLKEESHMENDLVQGLEVIDRNTRLQAQLIEDLLDMSRIVSGKVCLEVQQVDLNAIIESAVSTLQATADQRKITLQLTKNAPTAEMRGDRHRLQQIVLNLLSNALKFTQSEGKVEVLVEPGDQHIELTVSDTGIGIRRDFLAHVFERFRQADASTTRQHGGLGLGLAIVKQLVELHGGEVHAWSEGEGRGATFRVVLPCNNASFADGHAEGSAAQTTHPPAGSRRHIDLQGVRVLVVDDEPDSAGLVKRVLEGYHAEVRDAGSMEEALRLFEAFRPHILLSDIGMPKHDGYELIRRVREMPGGAKVPAAALTALARSEDVRRALGAGFQTHIAKPVEPAQLVTVTANLAGIARQGGD